MKLALEAMLWIALSLSMLSVGICLLVERDLRQSLKRQLKHQSERR